MRRLFTVLAAVLLGVTLTPTAAFADTYDGPIARIINDRSDRCLDQDYSGGTAHPTVLVWICNNQTNQQWRVTPQGRYYYTIRNVRSGKCLDQANPSTGPTLKLQVYTCNGGLNQRFEMTWFNGAGVWTDIEAYFSTDAYPKCLDQDYSGGTMHSNVLLYTCNRQTNQTWAVQNL
jgi:Ricin-type beta-trefoil lectin domain-like